MGFWEAYDYASAQSYANRRPPQIPERWPDLVIQGAQSPQTEVDPALTRSFRIRTAQEQRDKGQEYDQALLAQVEVEEQINARFWASRWSGLLGKIMALK